MLQVCAKFYSILDFGFKTYGKTVFQNYHIYTPPTHTSLHTLRADIVIAWSLLNTMVQARQKGDPVGSKNHHGRLGLTSQQVVLNLVKNESSLRMSALFQSWAICSCTSMLSFPSTIREEIKKPGTDFQYILYYYKIRPRHYYGVARSHGVHIHSFAGCKGLCKMFSNSQLMYWLFKSNVPRYYKCGTINWGPNTVSARGKWYWFSVSLITYTAPQLNHKFMLQVSALWLNVVWVLRCWQHHSAVHSKEIPQRIQCISDLHKI